MKRRLSWLCLLVGIIALPGCTTPMQKYWLNNQFYQSARYFEQNMTMDRADPEDLYFYCLSLYEIKNYEKFKQCRDKFSAKTTESGSINRTSPAALRAELHSFQVRNMIDLGADPARIQKEIDSSLALLNSASPSFHNGYKIPEIHIYETAGIQAAMRGDRATALAYIDKIKAVSSMAEFQLRPIKNAAVAGIYFILKDYGNAKKVIEEYSGSAFYAFATAMEVVLVFPMLVHYADLGTETRLDAWTERGSFLSEFMASKILYETGQRKEAKQGYEKLLSRKMVADYERLHWVSLADLASIYREEGKLKESVRLLEQAVELIENQRKTIFSEGSKIGFVGDKAAVYHDLIRGLYAERQYEKAFEYVERAKSRALVDLLASKEDFAYRGEREQEVRTLLASADSLETLTTIQDASADGSKTRTIRIRTREDLKSRAPELASLVTVTYQPVAQILSQIPADEALIEYYYRDRDLFVFILSDGRLQALRLEGDGLAEEVRAFHRLLAQPEVKAGQPNAGPLMESSRNLYNRLFRPLEKSLTKRSLIVVPHGILHYLPLNALHDGRNYLIDDYRLRLMPSASTMKYLGGKKARRTGGVLIFGNPDLGDPRLDLTYAAQEAKAIAEIRPGSRVLLGKEAAEAALRRYGGGYRHVHFATHGRFDPEAPLKSALLLSPDSGSSGLLSVDKLYSLNLDADLVTLSACETGLSLVAGGDDLVGLTRGFLYAGASSIVSSLWKVDDRATAELMKDFYRELLKQDKVEALRFAQLETKKQYPHPFYWAAFQLTGNAK